MSAGPPAISVADNGVRGPVPVHLLVRSLDPCMARTVP